MLTEIKRIYKILQKKMTGKKIIFREGANFSVRTEFEGFNALGRHSWLDGRLGYCSYIGNNCLIEGSVGKFTSIGHNVVVLTGTHPAHKFVSTCPSFYSVMGQNGKVYVKNNLFNEKLYADTEKKYGVIIGNDVWIGYGATILGGVKIGDGAIIGANSYVNCDVEPYSIVVGQPAKKIGYRFEQYQIEQLQRIKWWEKDEKWIASHVELFDDIIGFISSVDLIDKR